MASCEGNGCHYPSPMIAMDTSWESICSNPLLRNLPYKIETNRHNQIVMSPASAWHSDYQGEIAGLLKQLLPEGRVLAEAAIQTADGIKVADVAWISKDRARPYRRASNLPVAPGICVEVCSPGNSRAERQGKMQLYFEKGALEVWLCDEGGSMQFFACDHAEPLAASVMCPGFPVSGEWE